MPVPGSDLVSVPVAVTRAVIVPARDRCRGASGVYGGGMSACACVSVSVRACVCACVWIPRLLRPQFRLCVCVCPQFRLCVCVCVNDRTEQTATLSRQFPLEFALDGQQLDQLALLALRFGLSLFSLSLPLPLSLFPLLLLFLLSPLLLFSLRFLPPCREIALGQ